MGHGHGANEPDLGKALSALRAGDLDAADGIARRLSADTPNDPAVHQLAAVIALQRGEIEQAARAASASLARRPDHVPTLIIAGRAARASADLAAAAAFFRRAMALAPERADAAFCACVTLLERGDPEAQALLPRLLAQFPDDAEGWRNLAAALQKAGQLEAALVALARAAHAAPSVALHLQRGMLLESLDRRVDAIAAYRAATDMAPDNADALLKLGLCLRRCGDTDAAAPLEQAVECGQGNATPGSHWLWSGRITGTLPPRPKPIVAPLRSGQISPKRLSISVPAIRKSVMSARPRRTTGWHCS